MKLNKTWFFISLFVVGCNQPPKKVVDTSQTNYQNKVVQKLKAIHLYTQLIQKNYETCKIEDKDVAKINYQTEGQIKAYQSVDFISKQNYDKISSQAEDFIEDVAKNTQKLKAKYSCWTTVVNPDDVKKI